MSAACLEKNTMKTNTQTRTLPGFDKKVLLAAMLAAGLGMVSTGASAADANGTMTVDAVLTSSCSVSDSALDFGSISALDVTANVTADTGSTLQVACSTGTTTPEIYSIPGTSPRILNGSGTADGGSMAFNLSQTSGAPTDALPATAALAEAMAGFTANGAAQTVVIYGMIPTASFLAKPVGPYSATISINVDYS